ncbi:MAG: hypothetical protein RMJ98_13585 [Myxococcales bacterium]|nr:hypothetical protein [Polyangiaceae bacterium]MDW8250322.1 hypothetical protein [Myxococcales bacterium]
MTNSTSPNGADEGPEATALRTNPLAGGTLWLTQTASLSLWRGEVGLSDWLRIEGRDGTIVEMRLEPRGELRVGRLKNGMVQPPHLQSELFISSQAALLRHDGVRWWLRRRRECHERVPTVVGARALGPEEEEPLVHGTFLQVGRARGTFVDRRYSIPSVPQGAVDPETGLLGRVGMEQEISGMLSLGRRGHLVVLTAPPGQVVPWVQATMALHARWPRPAIFHESGTTGLLFSEDVGPPGKLAEEARALILGLGLRDVVVGLWPLEQQSSPRELELALYTLQAALAAGNTAGPMSLRQEVAWGRISTVEDIQQALVRDHRRPVVLFAMEETGPLSRIGPGVVPALERELCSMVASAMPSKGLVARMAPGVVAACLPLHMEVEPFASEMQREWQGRAPIVDGQIELPRSLCWETASGDPLPRAHDLARECSDPQGALQALSASLPYPIAGRVALAAVASSAVERVKLLFDVLEGAWRMVASLLVAAYFSHRPEANGTPFPEDLITFAKSLATRHAYPLGKWRELARLMARELAAHNDMLGQLARELLRLRQGNETLEALANQLHPLRNQFAHNVYPEARAQRDLPFFEQVTREFLRALHPLSAWTLVTVEKAEPDLYADTQMVEYIDHTGPSEGGIRRRVGFKSSIRLAHVVYLTRWRDGLVVPLEPFLRRRPRNNTFDLFWAHHLPRPGSTTFASVITGDEVVEDVDERRLPPRLRDLLALIQRSG